jgi:ribosomal-protein-alanine N-acetyltransferase
MKIFAQTPRLLFREIIHDDADAFFEMDSDPEVHKYLGNEPVVDKEKIHEVINFIQQQYTENGIGRWAIIEKSTNAFVGWGGLKLVKVLTNNHIDYYDMGYRINRKYWLNGIASESAVASLAYGFEVLQLKEIFASAHVENAGSNKILLKCGMKFLETFYYDESILCNWYTIQKDDWMKKISINKS